MAVDEIKKESIAMEESLSSSELDSILNSAEITRESEESEDEALEQYGVWVKVKPEPYAGKKEESPFELSDLELPQEESLTQDEEKLLGELETGSSPAGTAEAAEAAVGLAAASAAMEGLPDLELEGLGEESEGISLPSAEEGLQDIRLEEAQTEPVAGEALPELEPEITLEEPQVEVPLSESVPRDEHFDDLGALEEELVSARTAVSSADRGASDILKKIEQELQSIKREIHDLKQELSAIGHKKEEAIAGETAQMPFPQVEEKGFFEEEEDETIALTGDELDNILNTADITEEVAESPQVEAEDEILKPGSLTPAAEASSEAIASEELEEIEVNIPEKEETEDEPPAADISFADEELQLEEEPDEAAETEELVLEAPEAASPDLSLELPEAEDKEIGLEELENMEIEAPLEMEAAPAEEAPKEEAMSLPIEEELEMELPGQETLSIPSAEAIAEAEPLAAEEPAMEMLPGEEGMLEPGTAPGAAAGETASPIPENLKADIKSVLSYLDQLLEALPEEKIREFANSEYFGVYRKLFEELGLET